MNGDLSIIGGRGKFVIVLTQIVPNPDSADNPWLMR
jgi:hypothetical protein